MYLCQNCNKIYIEMVLQYFMRLIVVHLKKHSPQVHLKRLEMSCIPLKYFWSW